MKKSYYILTGFVILVASLAVILLTQTGIIKPTNPSSLDTLTPTPTNSTTPKNTLADPIDRATERVTKKSFGTFVTPKNSPVQPEKFTGFHTGTDFETFAEEANTEVPIYAICDGKIIEKKTASGYGGVLVQSCAINHQPVTVVYGHVSLKSISKNKGDALTTGEKIGILGQPPGETDGERKHLHLSIHKGTAIDIRGYVQNQSDLTAWLDWEKL